MLLYFTSVQNFQLLYIETSIFQICKKKLKYSAPNCARALRSRGSEGP